MLDLCGAMPANAAASEACRAIDPELQGHKTGPVWQGVMASPRERRFHRRFCRRPQSGMGIKAWPNGVRYESIFARQGHGAYRWGAGSAWAGRRYVGAYEADWREGLGSYEWPDGRKVSGQ